MKFSKIFILMFLVVVSFSKIVCMQNSKENAQEIFVSNNNKKLDQQFKLSREIDEGDLPIFLRGEYEGKEIGCAIRQLGVKTYADQSESCFFIVDYLRDRGYVAKLTIFSSDSNNIKINQIFRIPA